jgi:outer membrane protein OmpA-like peptidoglycan-associated protein
VGKSFPKRRSATFACLIVLIFAGLSGSAQNQTLYFNKSIPQAASVNPSFIPDYKYTFSVPMLSSYNVNFRTPFSLKTLHYTTEGDTGYFDLDYLLKKTRKKNTFSLDGNIQLITLGYNTGKTYISFDYSDKFTFDFRYPKDLINLIWKGNEPYIGSTAKLDNTAINFSQYNEISLGVAQQLPYNITAGGRLKYLQGLANFNTKKSNISLHTDTTTYWLTGTADMLLNMSGPYNLDTFYLKNPVNYLFSNFHNPGFGIDLGVAYKMNKNFNFSANVLDLGYIYWKNNTTNYSVYNSGFSFKGFTLDSLTNFKDIKNLDSLLTEFADSLTGEFDTVKTSNRYRTGLYPKLYLSVEYFINNRNKVGLLYYHRFMGNTGQNTISLAYNHSFGKTLAATATYSLNDFRYSLLGLGLVLNLGSFQFYALSDNVVAIFNTSSSTSAHINLGINFMIGKPYNVQPVKGLKINKKLDTDHDKVPDYIDKCPSDSGLVSAEGCPDSDFDSTGDVYDLCPNTPGPRSNNGCPEISSRDEQLINIIVDLLEFRTGSDKMKSDAFVYLDELVGLLNEQPNMLLKLEGHAYDMPTFSENMKLSKARVNSLIKYLTDKGISANRIKASWYGSDRPYFDTENPGQPVKKNRIEMNLYFE